MQYLLSVPAASLHPRLPARELREGRLHAETCERGASTSGRAAAFKQLLEDRDVVAVPSHPFLSAYNPQLREVREWRASLKMMRFIISPWCMGEIDVCRGSIVSSSKVNLSRRRGASIMRCRIEVEYDPML